MDEAGRGMSALGAAHLPGSGAPLGRWHGVVQALRAHPRRVLVAVVVAAGVAGSIMLAPALARLPHELAVMGHGDVRWLLLEALSFAGQVLLFRTVYEGSGARIGFRDSYEITLAGHAATRLLASAGTGGMALSAWSLRRLGLRLSEVARRMIAFLVLMYSVYTLARCSVGSGCIPGRSPGVARSR